MPLHPNEVLVRLVYQRILNEGELALADAFIAADAVDHAPDQCSSLPCAGPADLKMFVASICEAFPDVSWRIDTLLVGGDLVAITSLLHGSHHGEFRSIPASGQPVVLTGVDIVRIAHGQIVEHWGTLAPLDRSAHMRHEEHHEGYSA
jgi:predicted SnoaL-like aldol condensation-catalyzing enzyme